MTREEIAIAGNAEIEQCAEDFRAAVRLLNADVRADPVAYRVVLVSAGDSCRRYLQKIENVIAAADILGIQRSEVWANDLAASAANALDLLPSYYRRIRRDFTALGERSPEPSPAAFFTLQSAVITYSPEMAEKLRQEFELEHLPVEGFKRPARMNKMYSQTEKIAMASVAVAFLLIMLGIGVFVKDFNAVNIWIFRVVLSLAAGAFGGVFIGGFIHVEGKVKTFTVRAGGAAAFFLLVYLANPPVLVSKAKDQPPVEKASPVPQTP